METVILVTALMYRNKFVWVKKVANKEAKESYSGAFHWKLDIQLPFMPLKTSHYVTNQLPRFCFVNTNLAPDLAVRPSPIDPYTHMEPDCSHWGAPWMQGSAHTVLIPESSPQQ